MARIYTSVRSSIEPQPSKLWVTGSNPVGVAIGKRRKVREFKHLKHGRRRFLSVADSGESGTKEAECPRTRSKNSRKIPRLCSFVLVTERWGWGVSGRESASFFAVLLKHALELPQIAWTEQAAQQLDGHLAGAVVEHIAGNKQQALVGARQGNAHAGIHKSIRLDDHRAGKAAVRVAITQPEQRHAATLAASRPPERASCCLPVPAPTFADRLITGSAKSTHRILPIKICYDSISIRSGGGSK
jgi:hypothetical protein